MQFLGHFMESDSGSSVLSAGNGSGMIPKLSVNRGVHCSLRGKEPSSDSCHIVGKCRSVSLEQKRVQDNLAALLLHSQSLRMRTTLEFELN